MLTFRRLLGLCDSFWTFAERVMSAKEDLGDRVSKLCVLVLGSKETLRINGNMTLGLAVDVIRAALEVDDDEEDELVSSSSDTQRRRLSPSMDGDDC